MLIAVSVVSTICQQHPSTVSPEGLGPRSTSPPPAGFLSEEDAEELISAGERDENGVGLFATAFIS